MLFYSVFQTFHRKNVSSVVLSLNPEGPSGSYLCDFLPGDKKSKFLSFLRSIFLVPVFLCSFLIPFTEDFIIFLCYIRHLSYCFCIPVNQICVAISRADGALKPWSAIHLGEGNSKQKPTYLDLPVPAM